MQRLSHGWDKLVKQIEANPVCLFFWEDMFMRLISGEGWTSPGLPRMKEFKFKAVLMVFFDIKSIIMD